jgi:hypothetical protein
MDLPGLLCFGFDYGKENPKSTEGMNWTAILANANIPEPPGMAQCVAAANAKTAARKAEQAAAEAARRKPR